MNSNSQEHERNKWNHRYLSGTHGGLQPDQLLIEAFDRYIEPLYPHAGTAVDFAGSAGHHSIISPQRAGECA